MAVTINLKQQVDLPVWEWTRFAPTATATVSCMTVGDLPSDSRYMYYYSTSFYRYDTWTDTWMQLASANTAPATVMSMRYSSFGGFRGRVISGTTTTLTIPALRGNIFSGKTIRIYNGTGNGQIRTITDVSDATVYEQGVVTTAGANSIQDTTKRWKWNQWRGYQVGVVFGLGVTQRRKVLYNDANTLYFSDPNYQQIDPWNNTGFSAIAPYAIPAATAGSQSMYFIEASVVTVDSPWTIIPDNTSRFTIQSGGIWMLSSAAATPFYTLQYYDIAADAWFTKTAVQNILPAAAGTDITIERISNSGGYYLESTGTTGTTRTLIDLSLTGITIDRYVNCQIRIMSGTGMGQKRRIIANSGTTFTVNRKWDIVPDNTTAYQIWDDLNVAYIGGSALASIYQYNIESDLTTTGSVFDYGLARNMAIRCDGWEDVAVTTATRNTNGILAINTTPVAGGSGYVVGEIITLGTGTNGKVIVEQVSGNGIVSQISLLTAGSGYAAATANQSATTGVGTGLQVSVTSVGTVGRITTAINHFFKIGDSVSFNGANENAWNTTYSVLGVDSLTTLDLSITASLSATASFTQSASVLVDSSANWDVNEHVGKIVEITVSGTAPTSQIRRITANSGTTLTLQSNITAAVNGTSRYTIQDVATLGRDEQYRWTSLDKSNTGYATAGTTTTLIDTTKNWNMNQWANHKIRILSGTGFPNELTILSNSGQTLTYATQTFTPDASTKYQIMDTFGLSTAVGTTTLIVDTTKNWQYNQWAGKRVKYTSGSGVSQEATILSNTPTGLTLTAAVTTASDTTTTYTILGIPVRGAGVQLIHMFGTSNPLIKGKYMFFPRGGGSTTADRFDISKEVWEYGYFFSPQTETLTTGSMYAYDGGDIIYYTKDSTGRIYCYDIRTNTINNSGTIPYGMSTAIIGNRMEIIETEDGLKYLYIMRHTGTEMFRVLVFWQ